MLRRVQAIYYKMKSVGVIAGINWLITTSYHRLIPQKQVIWCTDLTKINTEGFLLPDNLNIQRFNSINQINGNDLKSFLECDSYLMGSATIIIVQERFNKGATLWLLKANGEIAGYWWTITNNHVTPTYLPHTETDVHAIGIELFEDFRGQHLFELFRRSILTTLKSEGFKRYYAETYLWNEHAVEAFIKVGENKVGIATRFSICGKNVVVWHEIFNKINFK